MSPRSPDDASDAAAAPSSESDDERLTASGERDSAADEADEASRRGTADEDSSDDDDQDEEEDDSANDADGGEEDGHDASDSDKAPRDSDAGDADAGDSDAGDADAGDADAGDADAGDADAGDSDAGDSDAGDSDAGDSDAGETESTSSKRQLGKTAKKRDIRLTVYGRTDVGQIREHNEDNFLIADLSAKWRGVAGGAAKTVELGDGGMLLVVCDGMGGAAAGEVASQLAIDIVYEKMLAGAGHHDHDQLALDVVEALEDAGSRILDESNNNRACRGMGTTATVAALVDDLLMLGQVGDSRAYILRGERLVQVTRDQSLVNQLIEAGQLTEEEAENFEHSNIILQALGTADAVQVDLTFAELRAGDVLMMCSDGLSGMIRDSEIRETLLSVRDPVDACRVLIDDANQAGGHDNITVIVAVFDGEGLQKPTPADVDALKYAKYTVPSWADDRADATDRVDALTDGYDDTPTIEIVGEYEIELRDDWEDRLLGERRPETPVEEPPPASNFVIWVAVAVLVFALYYLMR